MNSMLRLRLILMGLIGSSGSGSDDEPFMERLKTMLSQSRQDGQLWVGLGFVAAILIGAVLIAGSRNLPGVSLTMMDPDGNLEAAASLPDGNSAALIIQDSGTNVVRLLDGTSIELPSGFGAPEAIDGYEGGWLIGSDTGEIARCTSPDGLCTNLELNWAGNDQDDVKITGIHATSASEGVVFTESSRSVFTGGTTDGNTTEATDPADITGVRAFGNGVMSQSKSLDDIGHLLRSFAVLDDRTLVGVGDVQPNPALLPNGEVVYSIKLNSLAGMKPTTTTMVMYSNTGSSHTAIEYPDDGLVENVDVVIGLSSATVLASMDNDGDINLKSVPSSGSSALAIDDNGRIWLASPVQGEKLIGIIDDRSGSSTEWKRMAHTSVNEAVGVSAGEEVHFIGGSSGVDQMTVDPDVMSSVFRNTIMLSQLIFILVALTATVSLGWVVVDQWGEGSW